MKIVRVSWYNPQDLEAMTVFFELGDDAEVDEEAYGGKEVEEAERAGYFAVSAVEEVKIGPNADASFVQQLVVARWMESRQQVERNMAILYYYDAQALLLAQDGGVISTTAPGPLDVDDVTYVLKRLAKHPSYRGQSIIAHARGMEAVVMRDGNIKVENMAT